jgi:uncharacterized membrane protein
MPMRVHEIHPALAHFPVALVPTAVGADVVGSLLGDNSLQEVGRKLMPLAVASMAPTGIAGFMAQSAVKTGEEANDLLVTHRNLNIGLLVLTTVLARVRAGQRQPSPGYLLAGLAAAALATYTGYLGGRMVYTHGVGVKAAEGYKEDYSPDMFNDDPRHTAQVAAADTIEGVRLTAKEIEEGKIAPALGR